MALICRTDTHNAEVNGMKERSERMSSDEGAVFHRLVTFLKITKCFLTWHIVTDSSVSTYGIFHKCGRCDYCGRFCRSYDDGVKSTMWISSKN